MKKLVALSAAILACSVPQIASSQTPAAEPVSLILVAWLQPKGSAAPTTTTPTMAVVGSFNDGASCMAAARKAQRANGDDPLAYNFICVPNR